MQIWAHTLVQNEGRFLWFSVTSVIDHVDKVLLWDFGSKDDSMKIARNLEAKYPGKIILKKLGKLTPSDFSAARQEMLDATRGDWILMLDGDEVWWEDSIRKVVSEIKNKGDLIDSIVVPTVNSVGDLFHYQEPKAGMYNIAGKVGHLNMRAINKSIPGLISKGEHGKWGWADESGKMIQERDPSKISFLNAPYLHLTFLKRSSSEDGDIDVAKRKKKLKRELGIGVSADYYFPEAFFKEKPLYVSSPWELMSFDFKIRAMVETPLRKLKRRVWKGGVGY